MRNKTNQILFSSKNSFENCLFLALHGTFFATWAKFMYSFTYIIKTMPSGNVWEHILHSVSEGTEKSFLEYEHFNVRDERIFRFPLFSIFLMVNWILLIECHDSRLNCFFQCLRWLLPQNNFNIYFKDENILECICFERKDKKLAGKDFWYRAFGRASLIDTFYSLRFWQFL